ncbi:hypothetical protein CEXT_269451 [Caerostris extrusa]|uniref:Uncharacterized protein n=1 Tax=Caerostris extrusa TaxID=172846 RepID=A0AAV4SDN7_CAEEX|nr:hypothetical protein CEXT_269451 [Caerostris extrusa]
MYEIPHGILSCSTIPLIPLLSNCAVLDIRLKSKINLSSSESSSATFSIKNEPISEMFFTVYLFTPPPTFTPTIFFFDKLPNDIGKLVADIPSIVFQCLKYFAARGRCTIHQRQKRNMVFGSRNYI